MYITLKASRCLCIILTIFSVALYEISVAADVDISKVKNLAKCPVDIIFRGTPVIHISDADYTKKIQKSMKPSVVVFYINQDKSSQKLATLIRYLAIHFHEEINFFAYKVSEKNPIKKNLAATLQQNYSLDQIPGTFIYVREKEEKFVRGGTFNEPKIKEYMIPSMFLWETYYHTAVKYIKNSSFIKKQTDRKS